MKKIVIDTLDSDKGDEEIILGAIQSHRQNKEFCYVLVGIKENIERVLIHENENLNEYEIIDSLPLEPSIHDVMSMLRYKGHCSIVDSFDYAKRNEDVIGVVSAGPTGMILVSSIRHIGLLENVSFPVLGTFLFNIHGNYFCLVDCGANIEVREDKIVQFAQMGTALMRSYCGIEKPRVGLMNVGKEPTKGDSIRKAAYQLLSESNMNFYGNIEGNDVFLDKVDVVTCDGFSGNLILKNAEAVGMIAMNIAKQNHDEKTAKQLYDMFAYNELGGAILLGTKKVVIKAHGAANRKTIQSVIKDVIKLDKNYFIEHLHDELLLEKE